MPATLPPGGPIAPGSLSTLGGKERIDAGLGRSEWAVPVVRFTAPTLFNLLSKTLECVMGVPNATAVERALAILDCLDSSKRGMNISEMSRRLRIPKSSTHVIVVTLERLGYLERKADSLNYHLGLRAYGLGRGMMKNLSLAELALPNLRVLVDQVRLPAHLAVGDGEQGVYIQKVDTPSLLRIDTYVGRRMDLHCTAVGKVILACENAEFVDHILAKKVYIRYTTNTITSSRALRRELIRVQKSGFALDDEEEELGVRCVAVPVFDHNRRFAAGLSVTGTMSQIPNDAVEAIANRLKDSAVLISSACQQARAQESVGMNGFSASELPSVVP